METSYQRLDTPGVFSVFSPGVIEGIINDVAIWYRKKGKQSTFFEGIEGETETPGKNVPSNTPAWIDRFPTFVDPSRLAIIQTAGNIVYRAFLGADTNVPNNLLPRIARALVLNGECVVVDLDGVPTLQEFPFYDVRGGNNNPSSWAYQVNISLPSKSRTIYRPGSEVMHFRLNEDTLQPWRGTPPWKSDTATLLAKIEASLSDQTDIPVFQTIRRTTGFHSNLANSSETNSFKSALRARAKILLSF